MFLCRLEDLLGDLLLSTVGIGTPLRCIETTFHGHTVVSCSIASHIGALCGMMLDFFWLSMADLV